MDSLNVGNPPNVYSSRNSMWYSDENSDFDDDIDDPRLSIIRDARSRVFFGPNSDDDDRYKFFMICAENKINALIERVREYHENFGRSDVLEDEAVAMAIRQHGLRKNTSSDISPYGENYSDEPTTSTSHHNEDDDDDDFVCRRRSKRKRHLARPLSESEDDDLYFLDEAVATAIEQKGLCSSTPGALN